MKHKNYLVLGSISGLLFVFLSLLIHVKYQGDPIPLLDGGLQLWAAHLQDNVLLLHSSRIIDHSLVPLTLCTAIIVIIVFLFTKEKIAALYLGLILSLSVVMGSVLKIIVGRMRPETYRLSDFLNETGKSFPSGHVVFVSALFGCLFLLILPKIKKSSYKMVFGIGTWLVIVSTMVSRLILGVHYPSDTFGSLLLIFSILCLTYPIFLKFNHPVEWGPLLEKWKNK